MPEALFSSAWTTRGDNPSVNRYLHRTPTQARSSSLKEALDEPHTIEEIVAKVYVDTPQKVWHLAAKNVEAHLIRLCALGRVRQNGHAVSNARLPLRKCTSVKDDDS